MIFCYSYRKCLAPSSPERLPLKTDENEYKDPQANIMWSSENPKKRGGRIEEALGVKDITRIWPIEATKQDS